MMFPNAIHDKLGYYVYRLIDPRTGMTFYVGKGRGNRVFQHVADELVSGDEEDVITAKIAVIRQIKNVGLEPIHIIHRHGLTEQEAYLVEAALIDALGGLTNIVGGQGSVDYGPANAAELISRYALQEIVLQDGHKVISIKIRNTDNEYDLYDAVRFAWRININRAREADYIFASSQGVCKSVFIAEKWLSATKENFPEFSSVIDMNFDGKTAFDKRYGFVGGEAPQAILDLYKGKLLPESMRWKPGAASPIRYSW